MINICMRKCNENAMFVGLFRITLHVLPPVGQPRKGWIGRGVSYLCDCVLPGELRFESATDSATLECWAKRAEHFRKQVY